MLTRSSLLTSFLLLLLPSAAAAATLRVPEDFPHIQAAIDAASTGDEIRVGPGTYDENLVLTGKTLTLVGTAGAGATIVDGGQRGSVLFITSGVVDGFTLRNGYAGYGAGIYVRTDDPVTVRNCIVRDNDAEITGGIDPSGFGGGIYIWYGGSLVIERNVITGNGAWSAGGGICCDYCEGAEIRDNLISGNGADDGGGVALYYGGVLERNRIVGNGSGNGAIVHLYDASSIGNTVVGNRGLAILAAGHAVVERNVVAGNQGYYRGGGISCGTSTQLQCNDSWNNLGGDFVLSGCDTTGKHNFSADPLFCGPDDYHLSTASPCLGLSVCGPLGALPAACGPTATRRVTWGALKSAYR